MAGAGRVRRSRRLREAPVLRAAAAAGVAPEEWRDWAGGLPAAVLLQVGQAVALQAFERWYALQKRRDYTDAEFAKMVGDHFSDGMPLFVFAMVCKGWRKAQLEVGGRMGVTGLRTRVKSDVIMLGRAGLAKWALAEGCPRDDGFHTMAHHAAIAGKVELVHWLCGEGGFAMGEMVMVFAAGAGHLELAQWLRTQGCPWDASTCYWAVEHGHVEVLRWARENGCEWTFETRYRAAEELGYKDDLGNLACFF